MKHENVYHASCEADAVQLVPYQLHPPSRVFIQTSVTASLHLIWWCFSYLQTSQVKALVWPLVTHSLPTHIILAVTDNPQHIEPFANHMHIMPPRPWKPLHHFSWSIFISEISCCFVHGEDRMHNLPSHMDCSMLSWSWWECWLCIWLFP